MNVLLHDWEYPPFDQIRIEDYEPAIRSAIEEAERTLEAIATSPEPPTFENTVEALECADRRLNRVSSIMLNLNECCTSEELQEVVMRMEPLMTRFSMKVMTDERLYRRVKKVSEHSDYSENPEKRTLLENTLKSFRRHGVALEGEARERYKRNEEELSELKQRFSRNALADMNEWTLHLTSEADLEGLPEAVRSAAREEAEARGLEGWLFTLAAPSYLPFMTYSARGDLREKMYRAYGSIGGRGNGNDNNEVIRRIVALRAEQAGLLGFPTYCDYVLEDRMVQSLGNLRRFMDDLKAAVLPAARQDLADVGATAAWDFSFLAERLKQQRYDFDSESLRPYFPLDAVREGIFGLYGKLYGLHFEPAPDVPVYHEDVSVFRVSDDTAALGILYLDMHPRPSKRSGAWMKTFMHEMGHAMHGMLSNVKYESLSGTNVKRDFVEMPSQVMENWCYEPEFLATFARHWQTGEPLPTEYVDKIRAAQNHLAGWLCLRQLNLGYTDIAFHTMSDVAGKAEDVESRAMENLLPRVDGCCTSTNFSHIFGGGYASGYYGYKWAEVLDADIFSRFKADGIFNRDTAEAFRREILSRGGTEHPAVLFRNFMGREPDNKALLKRMNLL